MPISAMIRLQRVLDLEEKQGWRNRGVIGGMKAMAERWGSDALGEQTATDIVGAVQTLMLQYDSSAQANRPQIAAQMRQALTGNFTPVAPALAEDGALAAPPAASQLPPPAQNQEAPPVQENRAKPRPPKPPKEPRPPKPARPEPKAAPKSEPKDLSAEQSEPTGEEDARVIGKPATVPTGNGNGDAPTEEGQNFGNGNHYVYVDESFAPPLEVPQFRPRAQRRDMRSNRNPRDLQAPVTILPGVGEATGEQLAKLEIIKVVDLLWHLPVRHEDYSHMKTIAELQPGEQATVIANLWDVKERKLGINRSMLQGIIADGTGTLHATWWNKFIKNQLPIGSTLRFSGKVGLYMGQKTLDNPAFEDADAEMLSTGRLSPIYRLTEGLTHKRIRNLVLHILDEYAHFLSDPLPRSLCEKYKLPDLASSLWQIHFPDNAEELRDASKRLAFEEFFYIQMGVLQRRRELQQSQALALPSDEATLSAFYASLPFALTGAQQRVINEIAADLTRSIPMTRMIQGDVGSGKTAVAACAMWIAANHGAQAALLAPTQILAEQHHRGLAKLLGNLQRPDGANLVVELLTGRVTGAERQRILTGLQEKTIDVVVGTTALIQDNVEFSNLGLVVVDEQHRFGVEQRSVLRNKSLGQPHLLVMSATPIPRSLALTIYGDLDLSVIDEMPPGRIPIQTKLFRPSERERLYSFMRKEAGEGRQAFIVYPLVEESEKLDVGAAVEAHERLSKEILPELRIGLLHGRMSGSEKDEVMRAFANHDYDALVSTSVIEVGIDIPNASLIVIEDAERFGLSQLHQFRGRVGRGQHKSYCALVSSSESAIAEQRLRALEATNSGFELAEKDLELRGPGDFLGTRQSGLPELRIAHLSDLATLSLAREAAQQMFAEDPLMNNYPQLAKQVSRFWRGHGDVN